MAVYASPHQTVIAGPPEQIDALIAVVDAARAGWRRRIDVDVASHHPTIDPILPELRAALADLAPRQPDDPDHQHHLRRTPARHRRSTPTTGRPTCATRSGSPRPSPPPANNHATFIEISPHPLLTYAINDTLADTHHHSIGTLQRDTDDTLTFHTNLNATHTAAPPRTPHPPEPHPPIPTTPWHHTHHWIGGPEHRPTLTHDGQDSQAQGAFAVSVHPLMGAHVRLQEEPERHVWQGEVGTAAQPWLGDHQIHNVAALPGAAYCEMALAAARTVLGEASEVRDIRFEQMLLLDERDTGRSPSRRWMRRASSTSRWRPIEDGERSAAGHRGPARGRGRATSHRRTTWPPCSRRTRAALDGTEMRQRFDERGIQYRSGVHRSGRRAHRRRDGGTVLAEVALPGPIRSQQTAYGVHPALLDACFQSVAAHPGVQARRQWRPAVAAGRPPAPRLRSCPQRPLLLHAGDRSRRGRRSRPTSTCSTSTGRSCWPCADCRLGTGVSESGDRDRVLAERLLTIEWQQRELPDVDHADAGSVAADQHLRHCRRRWRPS